MASGMKMKIALMMVAGGLGFLSARQAAASPEEDFVRMVAATRSPVPVTALLGPDSVQGYYLGRVNGCDRVFFRRFPRRSGAHYDVCGDNVSEISDVAPALPRDQRLSRLREETARRAWETRTSAVAGYEGYVLSAAPIGISDSQGCMAVEEYVTYESLLVDRRQSRVCP